MTNNNLGVLKQDVLNDLKDSININDYRNHDNTAILQRLNITSLPTLLPLDVTNAEAKSADDLDNSIKVYEALKDLPLSLASDERLWAYLTHTVYWDYMCQRWPIQDAEGDALEFIKIRYFFSSKGKTFYRNGLSRLWWYAYLTYDSSKEDPYYYTKMMLLNQDIAGQLIENTNLSRNKIALNAVLKALQDFYKLEEKEEIEKVKNKRNTIIRPLMKHINVVGGVTVWDVFTEEEAYNKVWKFIESKIVRIPQTTN